MPYAQPNTAAHDSQGLEYIEKPERPFVVHMAQWWFAHADPPTRIPHRSDFTPEAMPRALPNIWLMDVSEGPRGLEFYTRLWGTGCTQATGVDRTGVATGEDPERFGATAIPKWQRAYRRVFDTRQPTYFYNRLVEYGREFVLGEVGIFPFSRHSDNRVSIILGIFDIIRE